MNHSLSPSSLKDDFLASLKSGNPLKAIHAAKGLTQEQMGIRQLSFIRKAIEKTSSEQLPLKPLKVALLSSFSIDFIHDALITHGFLNGIRIEIYQAGFGQFRQEILDEESSLYRFSPDAVILAVEGREWAPTIYDQYLDQLENGFNDSVVATQNEIATLIKTFRSRSEATLLVHGFVPPVWPQLGILDGQLSEGQKQLVHRLNKGLFNICRNVTGVYVVDCEGLVARFGAYNWYDLRMDHYARAPIATEMLGHLAAEYVKFFRGLTGQTKKCLVVDLDNTLWGGVIGEDGISGIKLGPDYPGNTYIAFQKEILNLYKRGVLLAISSKNNLFDVDEVFSAHPHMVLKKEHFAEIQVHWQPKSRSLVEISKKLNIGLEHMVFVDDNPVECEQIASVLPMVKTIRLPKQPEHFVSALLKEGLFEGLSFSSEDRMRGKLYRQRSQAESLRKSSASIDDFYRGLGMELIFSPVHEASLARAAQLTQKTNQFNLTTIRYSESELSEHFGDSQWVLTTVRVRDRFGDNGIVGLMLASQKEDRLEIDTFLLSCRVIGRTVETAMLANLCECATNRRLKSILGRVIPTAKNVPARDLFKRHGFRRLSEQGPDESSWLLELKYDQANIPYPEWFKVTAETES